MVRIRLQRHGRNKRPYYHIVAADIRKKRDGGIIEDLGRFNPVVTPKTVTLKTERIMYWLQNGAQPSDAVRGVLKAEGIYYRLHLVRWGKSAEEIEQAIADWKAAKKGETKVSPADVKRAALIAEEEQYKKALAEKAAEKAAAPKKEEVVEEVAAEAVETTEATETTEAPEVVETTEASEATEEQKG